MTERPTSTELVEAVREFLLNDVMNSPDKRMAFQARVAANVLGIVERELQQGAENEHLEHDRLVALLGHEGDLDDLRAELATAIRSGDYGGDRTELLATLKLTALESLEIANPKYANPEPS